MAIRRLLESARPPEATIQCAAVSSNLCKSRPASAASFASMLTEQRSARHPEIGVLSSAGFARGSGLLASRRAAAPGRHPRSSPPRRLGRSAAYTSARTAVTARRSPWKQASRSPGRVEHLGSFPRRSSDLRFAQRCPRRRRGRNRPRGILVLPDPFRSERPRCASLAATVNRPGPSGSARCCHVPNRSRPEASRA